MVIEMKKHVGLLMAFLFAMLVNSLVAQDTGFFSGNGFKDDWGDSAEERSGSKTGPSIFGLNKGARTETAEKPGFAFPKFEMPRFNAPTWEMPRLFQGKKYPKPTQISDTPNPGFLSGLSRTDPTANRSADQPTFFERMNDRTREAFGRTRDGFSNFTERSRDTWDSITRGQSDKKDDLGYQHGPPLQPNLQSAKQANGSTSRF